MIPFFGLDRQYDRLKEELLEVTDDVLSGGQLMSGKYTEAFESWLANKNHSKYAITCHSGTQALEMIALFWYKKLKLHNKEPIAYIPTLTFPATANAFINTGWNIKLFDSDVNGQMDIPYRNFMSSDSPFTVQVGLYGESIKDRLPMNNVIEDGAQHWLSDNCHRIGSATAISFDPTKNLPNSGNGGAIVTNNRELYGWVKSYHNHGKDKTVNTYGTNSRMSEIDCAHLLIRSDYINDWQTRRKQIAEYYCDNFENTNIRPLIHNFEKHSFHKFVIDIDNRNKTLFNLKQDGIDCKIHYEKPLHEYEKYSNYENPGVLSTASSLCRRVISLPIYPELKDSEIEYITERVLFHTSA